MSHSENENSVAKVMEISARSSKSFDDAVSQGVARASKTIRHINSAWVKEQRVEVEDGKVVSYQVNLVLTFTLES